MAEQNPYGDDAGKRVGRPSEPKREQETDSGSEAARGIHGAQPDKKNPADRPGSEPLEHRENEHVSGYGGKGGEPKKSSDQR